MQRTVTRRQFVYAICGTYGAWLGLVDDESQDGSCEQNYAVTVDC